MRSLMGKLNKFALAPGSLSDIGAAAPAVHAQTSEDSSVADEAPKPKPAPKKKAPAPKPAPKPEETAEADAAAADPAAQEAADTAALE